MKKTLLVLATSLLLSTIAGANGMPPGALGLPIFPHPVGLVVSPEDPFALADGPCADVEAKETAEKDLKNFDAFFEKTAPEAHRNAGVPTIGVCNTDNLRSVEGAVIRGLVLNRDLCGVNYSFKTEEERVEFAKWARAQMNHGHVVVNSAICANKALHIINGVILPHPSR